MVSQIQLGNLFSANGRSVLGGTASGLDTDALVTSLVAAKQQPATDLQTKIDTNTKIISAYGDLRTKLAALQTDVDFLRAPPGVDNASNNAFAYRTASVTSNTSVPASTYLSVSVSPGATVQNYVIDNITQIATAKEQTTDTLDIATLDTAAVATAPGPTDYLFKAGTITLHNGTTNTDIELDDGDTLRSVVNKFNAVEDSTGISAQAIKTGDNAFQILFTSTQTGTDASFDLTSGATVTDASGVLTKIKSLGTGISNVQDANNASFDFNGITVSRQSNSIDDLVDGTTFNILQDTKTAPTTQLNVQISPDVTSVQNAITNFVNDYNSFKFFNTTQTALNADGTPATTAVLSSSPTLNSILGNVESTLTSIVSGLGNGDPSQLRDIGISFVDYPGDSTNPASGNILQIDTGALQTALQSNFSKVSKVFGFNFAADSTALQVFSHTKQLGTNAFTLSIDPSGSGTYQATYVDGNGHTQVANLTGTVSNGSILLSGQDDNAVDSVFDGLQMIYSDTAPATIHVTTSQGIADQLYNNLTDALDQNTGTIQNEVASINTANTNYQTDIDNINTQIATYKDQLLNKFADLEAAISKVNSVLSSLNAQQLALSSGSG